MKISTQPESRPGKTVQYSESKGAEEARQQLPAILTAAMAGRTTFITRHGRQVAAVVPTSAVKQLHPVSLLSVEGSGTGLWGKQGSELIRELRDEWNP